MRSDSIHRASESHGASSDWLHRRVAEELERVGAAGERVIDVGCGRCALANRLGARFRHYLGVDLVDYLGAPGPERILANLDQALPLPSACADAVVSIETIEHLENPRAFMRELARIVRPGGWIVVTTPNQLSLLSKLTLLTRNEFNAFQERPGLYPSHITALLEVDLLRIATECGLERACVRFSDQGRIPGGSRHWPVSLGLRGRWFSDNVLLSARRPAEGG